jgi:hydrogenase maturation protease
LAHVSTLILGYGNPGRLDDGLGPALADAVGTLELPGVTVLSDYQLSAEHAAELLLYDRVVFADASVNADSPFYLRELLPRPAVSFTSHSMRPEAVLSLATDSLGWKGDAYLLGIRGHKFNEFGEWLSTEAQANLEAATEYLTPALFGEGGTKLGDVVTGGPIRDSVRLNAGNNQCETTNM